MPRVAFANDHVCAGSFQNVFIMYVYGELSLDDLYATHDAHRALIAQVGITGALAVCAPNTAIPSSEVREASGRLMHELSPHLLAGATVVLGGGFWASAVRSFLAAVYFVARQPCPFKAFASTEEASRWLGPRLHQIPSQLVGAAQRVMLARPVVRAVSG